MNNSNEKIGTQHANSPQDESMERANQAFNKIKQEVQDMIQGNEQEDKME